MKKILSKKCIAVAVAAASAITGVSLNSAIIEAAQIINPNPLIDIVVNPCSDYSVSFTQFSQDLADALKDQNVDMSTVRITQAGIQLNTTDLSDWYVFDHYDVANPSFDTHNGRWPFFANSGYGGAAQMNIEQWFSSGTCNGTGNVRTLDKHILSEVDAYGKASMKFAGYGDKAYNDFLFYPASTRYKKFISFDIDAANVKTHSMDGSGFLINAGIDASGNLQGYLLYLQYSPSGSNENNCSGAQVSLYRLAGNQSAETIHNLTSNGLGGINCTALGESASITLNPTTKKTKVYVEISTDYVTVQEQPYIDAQGTLGTLEPVLNNVGINTATFPYTDYNGFGPFVAYNSHGCTNTSFFIYSDLVMSYQTDAFEAVRNSQFAHDRSASVPVKRFFINLADNDCEIPDIASEFNEGALRLINDKIKYISNIPDVSTDTHSSVSSVIGSANTYYTVSEDYATYVNEIASYIRNNGTWDTSGINVPSIVAPAAKFSIIGKDASDSSAPYVQTLSIHKKHLEDENMAINITFKDESYPVNASRPVVKWEYTIRNANGVIVNEKTVLSTSEDKTPPIIQITSDSAVGEYTLTLTVTDSSGVKSTSSTLPFTVIYDNVIPSISVQTATSAPGKANLTFTDALSGVQSYYIGAYTGSETQTISSFTTARPSATITVDVPQDGTSLEVHVWDECGNHAQQTYTTNKVTYIKGLENDTDEYDFTYVLTGYKIGAFPTSPTDSVNVNPKGFTGWFTTYNGSTSINTDKIVSANATYYGGWNSDYYNVTFNANGGTYGGTSPMSVAKGTSYTNVAALAQIPTKPGYDFTGWTLENGNALGTGSVQADCTLKAGWTYGKVTITLDPNGGTSGKLSAITGTNGSSVQSAINAYSLVKMKPTKAGYLFQKWTTARDDGTALVGSTVLGDNGITLYALWERDYMRFADATLPATTYGAEYSAKISATNGTGKYTYALAEGSTLPSGLTFNTATGVISGTILGTPSASPYSFQIVASEIVTAGMVPTPPITKSFSVVISAPPAPTLTDESVSVKADAPDIEDKILGVYADIVGVETVMITDADTESSPMTITVTVQFNDNYSSNRTQENLVISATVVNPKLEFKVSSIPSIEQNSPQNSSETALLNYLNSYNELQLCSSGNESYIAAKGTVPTQRTITYSMGDEISSKPFNASGDQTYNFSTTYYGNTLTRTLNVATAEPIPVPSLTISTSTIYKNVGDADFTPSFKLRYGNSEVTDANFTYSIIDNASGAVTLSGNTFHIVGAGTVTVKVSASYEASGVSTTFVINVKAKPEVSTDGVLDVDVKNLTAKLSGKVETGGEKINSAGFKFRKIGTDTFKDIPATVNEKGEFVAQISGFDASEEYEYYAYCITSSGEFKGEKRKFVPMASGIIVTESAFKITDKGAALSGTLIAKEAAEKGFEYKSATDVSFIKVPVTAADFTAEIKGLIPNTAYQFRAYAIIGGKTIYGEIVGFKTQKTTDELMISLIGSSDVFYPTSKEPPVFNVVADASSKGIAVQGTDKSIKSISVSNEKYKNGASGNEISLNFDGTVSVGLNVLSAKITITLSDGSSITVNFVRGKLNVAALNESEAVVSKVNQELLKASIGSDEINKLIENGSTVDVNLIVNDLKENSAEEKEFDEFIEEHIGADAHVICLDIKIRKTIDGKDVSYITKLTNKIYIELEIDEEFMSKAYDLRVLHKKHDGTIEIIDVVRVGNKIGFYADEFSPYSLVYVNKFTVDVKINGLGKVSAGDGSFAWVEGQDAVLTFIPSDGFKVDYITDNGKKIECGQTYTISSIDSNHTINVFFVEGDADTSVNPGTGQSQAPMAVLIIITICALIVTAVTFKAGKKQKK